MANQRSTGAVAKIYSYMVAAQAHSYFGSPAMRGSWNVMQTMTSLS